MSAARKTERERERERERESETANGQADSRGPGAGCETGGGGGSKITPISSGERMGFVVRVSRAAADLGPPPVRVAPT